jgi:tetrapyrrole methylase family protein / MazG family protein
VVTVPWFELDRIVPDHLTSVWLPPLGAVLSGEIARLATLVTTLRERCPWDREQTHGSLRPHLLEEAHEVLEALDVLAALEGATADDADGHPGDPDGRRDDADGAVDPYGHLVEELGDLLFQVVFHASLAAEQGQFTLADVATAIHDKLVARHPHVFHDAPASSASVSSAGDLAGNWEHAKRVEKGRNSVFDGIPVGLPALARAAKVLRKASVVTGVAGDDPSTQGGPGLALPDPAVAAAAGDVDGEVGAMLMAVVAMARHNGVDPESALRRVLAQFEAAVRQIEADPSLR